MVVGIGIAAGEYRGWGRVRGRTRTLDGQANKTLKLRGKSDRCFASLSSCMCGQRGT